MQILKAGCPLPSPFFFFNDTATTEIYTLSLHDALPIFVLGQKRSNMCRWGRTLARLQPAAKGGNMLGRLSFAKRWLIVVLLLTIGVGSTALIFSQRTSVKASDDKTIIRGGGTTIIHGGTGLAGG